MAKVTRKPTKSTKTSRAAGRPAKAPNKKSAKAARAPAPAKIASTTWTPTSAPIPPRRPLKPLHSLHFPNETPVYRAARNRLLEEEIALRRQIERVATQRRRLPYGGEVPENYVFEEGLDVLPFSGPISLSELFGEKKTLVIYSFMYGPKMERPCPSCTSILDGLNGQAVHIGQRVALVIVAKSPIERIRAFAAERGWSNLRILSSARNSYNLDYHGEDKDGEQWPVLNVFAKKDRGIHHTYGTEMLFAPADPGQDHRHVDLIWPLWNMLDLTPEGRGLDWRPRLKYD